MSHNHTHTHHCSPLQSNIASGMSPIYQFTHNLTVPKTEVLLLYSVTYMHTYIHTHIYIHTHTHTHTHTHKHHQKINNSLLQNMHSTRLTLSVMYVCMCVHFRSFSTISVARRYRSPYINMYPPMKRPILLI